MPRHNLTCSLFGCCTVMKVQERSNISDNTLTEKKKTVKFYTSIRQPFLPEAFPRILYNKSAFEIYRIFLPVAMSSGHRGVKSETLLLSTIYVSLRFYKWNKHGLTRQGFKSREWEPSGLHCCCRHDEQLCLSNLADVTRGWQIDKGMHDIVPYLQTPELVIRQVGPRLCHFHANIPAVYKYSSRTWSSLSDIYTYMY
jgi:hypothetical protein